jgi:D-alanine-D-alanine ligase
MVASGQGAGTGAAPLRVVVLYGGASAEHEVSCISARTVVGALDPGRYRIEVVGLGTDGRWMDATDIVAGLPDDARSLPEPDALLAHGGRVVDPLTAVRGPVEGETTVVWPVLHGPMGEDGTVQGLLEVAGVAYVGAGVTGSAAAMDKGLAKTAFAGAQIPQARWIGVRSEAVTGGAAEAGIAGLAASIEAGLGWPVYVKPANMGSSVGVHRAADAGELVAAVDDAASFDDYLVVEEEIRGTELEIGVLGLDPLRVSKPGRILPTHGTYDYEDKYLAGTAELRIPADVAEEVADEMSLLAVEACRVLRVDGMARVDFFLEDGTGRLLVNEINTLPGFTSISMYPAMWAESGLPLPLLAEELVRLALARHARRARRRTSR